MSWDSDLDLIALGGKKSLHLLEVCRSTRFATDHMVLVFLAQVNVESIQSLTNLGTGEKAEEFLNNTQTPVLRKWCQPLIGPEGCVDADITCVVFAPSGEVAAAGSSDLLQWTPISSSL